MLACIRQTAASHPKFAFTPTFIFCSPICPNNCGVVFLWKYILVFEKWFFSFDRSNMQIFTVDITRVVWPHLTNKLDLWYFCQHNPMFYHLNLIPCHYWSWQRFEFQFICLLHLFISVAWHGWHINSKMNQPPKYHEMGFSSFKKKLSGINTFRKLKCPDALVIPLPVAYCIVVKKTFQVTCGIASFQIQKMKLILFCRVTASSRR